MNENDLMPSIEGMLQEDKVIQEAMERTKQDDSLVQPVVTQFLTDIMGRVENPEDTFELRHGFLTLGKTLNYLAQALCKDYEHFQKELTSAHKTVVDKIMVSISPKFDDEGNVIEGSFDDEDFSLRRLMMMSGSLVDYVYWREALSHYAEKREELETENGSEKTA